MKDPDNKDETPSEPSTPVARNTPPRRRPTLATSRRFGSGRDEIQSKRDLFSSSSSSLRGSSHSSSRSVLPGRPPSRRVSTGGEGFSARLQSQHSTERSFSERFRETSTTVDLECGQHEVATMRIETTGNDRSNSLCEPCEQTRPRLGAEEANKGTPGSLQLNHKNEGNGTSSPHKNSDYSNPSLWSNDNLVEARLVVEETQDAGITEAAPIPSDGFAKSQRTSSSISPAFFRCFGLVLALAGITVVVLAVSGVFAPPKQSTEVDIPSIALNNYGDNLTDVMDLSEYLGVEFPPETLAAAEQEDSAQFKAFEWIKGDPYLQNYTEERVLQRFGLATFYYATLGENWFLSTFWISYEHHECDWYQNSDSGGSCNTLGQYEEIVLPKNQLSGTIPRELFLLSSLKQVRLNTNLLKSTIPTEIGLLSDLEVLELQTNTLGGSLPSQIVSLKNLRILWTARNVLEGTLPTFLGLLDRLQSLSIGLNFFSGSIPTEIGLMTELRVFNTDLNILSGSLPSELFAKATHLNAIKVSTNLISGTIPEELSALSRLEYLDVASNDMTGRIPDDIQKLSNLHDIVFSRNHMSGTIPSTIGELSLLEVLDLEYNNFSGSLPLEVTSLSLLERLILSGNEELGGSIPSELGQLEALSLVSVNGTLLSGMLPPNLCHIDILEFSCSEFLCGCSCPCDNSNVLSDGGEVASNNNRTWF